jgi:hypothetical protein
VIFLVFFHFSWQERRIDFTVEDFICECASMTSAIENELRRELEDIVSGAACAERC